MQSIVGMSSDARQPVKHRLRDVGLSSYLEYFRLSWYWDSFDGVRLTQIPTVHRKQRLTCRAVLEVTLKNITRNIAVCSHSYTGFREKKPPKL